MANRKIERMLFYIEPDPERFAESIKTDRTAAPSPNVAESAIGALIGIPGYESISNDLQSIAEHNDRVARYTEMRRAVMEKVRDIDVRDWLEKPPNNEFALLDGPLSDPGRAEIYETARLMTLRDRAVSGILKWKVPAMPHWQGPACRQDLGPKFLGIPRQWARNPARI